MKFAATFSVLAVLAACAAARAASVVARQDDRPRHFVASIEPDFGDTSPLLQEFEDFVCLNLPDGYQDDISSLLTLNTAVCDFYVDLDCPDGADVLEVNGAIPDLSTYGDGSWEDVISSAKCYLA